MNIKLLFALLLALCPVPAPAQDAGRRVTLVGDSLFGSTRKTFIDAINDNAGNSWVHTQHIWGGSTAYNNPVNHDIYSRGMEETFGRPDVVVFSFGTNDMSTVAEGKISMESAIQAMQALMNQAVVSGATCIVMLESSHRFRGDVPINAKFEKRMDDWFDHWHGRSGDNAYLGIPYKLLVADISGEISCDLDKYLCDVIHFNKTGANLAARAIVEQINLCPTGRWVPGTGKLKEGATFPPNPYFEYKVTPP